MGGFGGRDCSASPGSPSSSAGTSVLLVQGGGGPPLWVTADLSVPLIHTRISLGPSQSPKSPLCTFESFVFFILSFEGRKEEGTCFMNGKKPRCANLNF